MAYIIALSGDFLIATASNETLLRDRAEAAIAQAGLDLVWDDLTVIDGLTLYPSEDEAEEAGATVVYSGTSQGWLQDDEGRMIYECAARLS